MKSITKSVILSKLAKASVVKVSIYTDCEDVSSPPPMYRILFGGGQSWFSTTSIPCSSSQWHFMASSVPTSESARWPFLFTRARDSRCLFIILSISGLFHKTSSILTGSVLGILWIDIYNYSVFSYLHFSARKFYSLTWELIAYNHSAIFCLFLRKLCCFWVLCLAFGMYLLRVWISMSHFHCLSYIQTAVPIWS